MLGIVGISLDGLTVIGGLLIWGIIYVNHHPKESFLFPLLDFLAELVLLLSYIILFFVAISLTCLILALFALKKLKSNPKLSGYLFLVAAGISGVVNVYLMIKISLFLPIQSIIYLIAGILCMRGIPTILSEMNDEDIQIIK